MDYCRLARGLRSLPPNGNKGMTYTHRLIGTAAAVLLINLPFGYWRAGVKKFSLQWFVAVHFPVLLALALRVYEHIAFRLATLPLFVAVFFGGQWLGGRLRKKKRLS